MKTRERLVCRFFLQVRLLLIFHQIVTFGDKEYFQGRALELSYLKNEITLAHSVYPIFCKLQNYSEGLLLKQGFYDRSIPAVAWETECLLPLSTQDGRCVFLLRKGLKKQRASLQVSKPLFSALRGRAPMELWW